ncbi:SDR family NAD(P)-dependent oxidoreductase [Oricola sp.]|uniref:SDR family NAD(P)-dependent oxidoreductase n=1 Tax=Oricola sp. TaxID=1979950 RepID=UPI0025DE0279|nr:SDR family NAD(P)-dependent oxidoreductase [Oricola sp.]MCI5076868.1 SDR family NAD(P)-dependent oxidoreductase [Oricola sp.]
MRTAVVTGISSPLGLGIAQRLRERGFIIIGTSRRRVSALESLPGFRIFHCDFMDRSTVEEAAGEIARACAGSTSVWFVNAAGASALTSLEDADRQIYDLNNVNFVVPVSLAHALLPLIRKSAGRILWLGSQSSRLCAPLLGGYGASKAALRAYSEVLDLELVHFGARSIYAELGNVRTGLHNRVLAEARVSSNSPYARLYEAAPELSARMLRHAMDVDKAVSRLVALLERENPKPVVAVGRDAAVRALIGRLSPSAFRMLVRWRLDW